MFQYRNWESVVPTKNIPTTLLLRKVNTLQPMTEKVIDIFLNNDFQNFAIRFESKKFFKSKFFFSKIIGKFQVFNIDASERLKKNYPSKIN